ncbi:MAG TPA: 3-isopropylmalate dehydratase [Janthinobacterium sp.]|nr:3-isopropylmalate dehydratase [Janthinobacterium sp.]
MNETVRFDGRVLYLSADADLMREQMAGRELTLAQAGPLRDNVSTDEITPVTVMLTYDERLGQYPYVGFTVGDQRPIRKNAVRDGGFAVTVAGWRYGKGSSRESSPLAEQAAGIRLVIAHSFERIYQQNCDNIGLLTSTDFSLLERIAAGEAIPLTAFHAGRDRLTQDIIGHGGLLAYSKTVAWPAPEATPPDAAAGGPRTLVEKIIARHLHPDAVGAATGQGVFLATDWRFSHDYFTGMCAHLMHQAFGQPAPLYAPERIVAFQDHLVLAGESAPHLQGGLLPGVANLMAGHAAFVRDYPVRAHGQLDGVAGSEGICHAMMVERYALPGQVVVGTDSHTPHSGALGCLAFGAGATDVANSWVSGYVRCTVPPTLLVQIDGALGPGVSAKDLVLHLLRLERFAAGGAIGAVLEYAGAAVRGMAVDERATLTNMVAELGGFSGIVAPDEQTVRFLWERRGLRYELEPWMVSDPGATYSEVLRIDAGAIAAMVARPGDPGNGMPVHALAAPVSVDIAYGGSCTAGKRCDFDMYHEVLRWGVEHGMRVAPHTRLYLQFGTMDVREYCAERGYLDAFARVGATLVMPGCGACANCGPGQSVAAEQVSISAINRNFPGRSGPGQVWLASPYTVAASALAGHVATFGQLRERARGVISA